MQQESLRVTGMPLPSSSYSHSTEDLIQHYNCGDLDAALFKHDTTQMPPLRGHEMSQTMDKYFRQELIEKRNKRMGLRVLDLLKTYPNHSFFFAFGAGHFLGNHTVLDIVKAGGFQVEQIPRHWKLKGEWREKEKIVPSVTALRDFSVTVRGSLQLQGSAHIPQPPPSPSPRVPNRSVHDLWVRLPPNWLERKEEWKNDWMSNKSSSITHSSFILIKLMFMMSAASFSKSHFMIL
ncbi:unnamed protein product [Darwinula stevensoni]|uniref:Metalloprotease TIKI homolog n=1 Tax=Darwinula stevensoni TaxID=69355 RepID=A0A7R9ACA4_9CRUS|nr:unnamed protein product [Darwinula stevensoni]CAG0899614.1 unnamed protein product [Darwinula stevensoni]